MIICVRDFPEEMVEIDEIIERRKQEAAKKLQMMLKKQDSRERLNEGSLRDLLTKYMKSLNNNFK